MFKNETLGITTLSIMTLNIIKMTLSICIKMKHSAYRHS
jgi:hypothetical protein